MNEHTYRKLADHLDQLPGGFGRSESGAELRLLERLFTPEEAALAVHLTLDREEVHVIAERAGLPFAQTEQRLAEMAHKGLIFSVVPDGGPALYQAVPWVVGIYEFQVNRLSEEFLHDLEEHWRTMTPRPRVDTIAQMRTIPVGESLEPHVEALPYEQVEDLVRAQDRFAVAPCICRRHAKMTGHGCDAPEESCLLFGDFADYYARDGRGRMIDRAEVLDILARADAANLVLQPTNSQCIEAICCCCGCCCGVLGGLQRRPKPAEAATSSFVAQYDADLCTGCWACLDRCQMQAFAEDGDRVVHDADRCIGCGLCVTTCPSGALTLVRKPGTELTQIPATMHDAWREIVEVQSRARR